MKIWSVLALSLIFAANAYAADQLTFDVKGTNPGTDTGYSGSVVLDKLSQKSGTITWTTGPSKEVSEGIVIRTENTIGAAYGGSALYSLAVYELKGKRISATWTLASNPKYAGDYEIKGAEFNGKLFFADGTPGSVTFKKLTDDLYEVTWDLQSGRFQGVGVRRGNILVAAAGDPSGTFGVAGYTQGKGGEVSGTWATNRSTATGTETWTLPGENAPDKPSDTVSKRQIGNGEIVTFDGDSYLLKEKKSSPGQATSELREYLQDGETWEGYRKMVAFRMQHSKVNAQEFAKVTLEEVQRSNPGSYVKEVEMTPESATVLFIIVNNNDVEFKLWNFRKTKNGVPSAQFVLRNKAPYETQKKFKAEQERNFGGWIAEIKELGSMAEAYLTASANSNPEASVPTPAPAPANTKDEEISPELVKAIKKDMDQCSTIGQEFIGYIESGDTTKAVALLDASAFGNISREEFTKKLEASNQIFGKLKKYSPDKDATKFGVEEGVMTFTFEADAEYENAIVRESLRFIRSDEGKILFVSYNRAAK